MFTKAHHFSCIISMGWKHVLCMETVLCAAVGTASHHHGLEACTVYGDPTVCSCRHSKSAASVILFTQYGTLCIWERKIVIKVLRNVIKPYRTPLHQN